MTTHPAVSWFMTWLNRHTDAIGEWGDRDADDVAEVAIDEGVPRIELVPDAAPVCVDMTSKAAPTTYTRGSYRGKVKRTLFPRVDLTRREVVVCLHQTGVERRDDSPRWHLVTAHYVITPSGRVCHLHPIDTRLVAANRLDRAPYHAISIELSGNFEGVDGSGDWWSPSTMGRGRATEAQLYAGRWLVRRIARDVAAKRATVAAIVPHRIAGRDSAGKPNRPLCPGSRVWGEVAERVSVSDGIPVPRPGVAVGGSPVPESWRSMAWATLEDLGLASWGPR